LWFKVKGSVIKFDLIQYLFTNKISKLVIKLLNFSWYSCNWGPWQVFKHRDKSQVGLDLKKKYNKNDNYLLYKSQRQSAKFWLLILFH